jgi:hypothetical protein
VSRVVKTYTDYLKKKAEIRARQRQELADELDPYLKALGDEIIKAQADGKRIEDIEYEMGAKNRTLVYAAKRRSKSGKPVRASVPEDDILEPEKPTWSLQRLIVDEAGVAFYEARWEDGSRIGLIEVGEDNSITLPDEWALDKDNTAMYREIVQEIKKRFN